MFSNFIGAYSVISDEGTIYPISLVDISRDGCQFELPWNVKDGGKFEAGLEISMRMYFTEKSFIPVIVNIKNAREHIGKDGNTYMRYGCSFDESMPTYDAMSKFIEFMYSFAEHSSIDRGDVKSYFI